MLSNNWLAFYTILALQLFAATFGGPKLSPTMFMLWCAFVYAMFNYEITSAYVGMFYRNLQRRLAETERWPS